MGSAKSKLSRSHVLMEYTYDPSADFKTIPGCLQHYSNTSPNKDAVVFVSTQGEREVVTFKELFDKSKIVAHKVVSLGVKRQEVVALNLRPCPEWLYACFGAIMAGAVPLGVSFTYKDGSDLIGLMERLGTCSCLIVDPGYENENWTILSKLIDSYSINGDVSSIKMPSLRYLICHDPSKTISGVKPFVELVTTENIGTELPDVHENDVALLFQTSGSTGLPKAVAHTHASVINVCRTLEFLAVFKDGYRHFCERPFTWAGGFPISLFFGQTRVTISGFCPPPKNKTSFIADVVRQENCQILLGLSTVVHELLQYQDKIRENWPVKILVTGGQPVSKQTVSCIGPLCEYMLVAYGGTEFLYGSTLVLSNPDDFIEYNCGPIMPGAEAKVVDSNGKILPIGSHGEIYIKTLGLFPEYFNDPERTKAAMTDDGWYKTDDMGRMLLDGSLVIQGRKSNMIISGGMNVAPEILENLINRCPGVDSVILVPVPDDVMYQVVCACVKIIPGSGIDENDVRKFCEDAHGDKLGLFTVLPTFYMMLEEFPETSTGKVSRPTLKAMAAKAFQK